MNEAISSLFEERLKRLLDEMEIPPPVPEKPASTGAIPAPEPTPKEIARTFYPGINLFVHSEMPKTSTLPAVSIPFANEKNFTGKITLYKTDKPLQEHEKSLIETVLTALASHLDKLVRYPEMLTVPMSIQRGDKRTLSRSIIQESGFSLWNHEIVPVLSSIPSGEPYLASVEYQDNLTGQVHIRLQGTPEKQVHEFFLREVLSALQEHLMRISYKQFAQNLMEQQLSWENALEQILKARSPEDVLNVFCQTIPSPARAYLLYRKASDLFEILSPWNSQLPFAFENKHFVAEPILKVISYPEKILRISFNTEIPSTLRELKNLLSPEEHLLVIPLIKGETPEGCILLISPHKPAINEEDERKILHLARVASLVLHHLRE